MNQWMVICTLVVALGTPEPVPVIVTVNVPRALFFAVEMVNVDVEPVVPFGLKLAVVRAGRPLAESDTAPVNPPERVIAIA
jgi:hypothetical protein